MFYGIFLKAIKYIYIMKKIRYFVYVILILFACIFISKIEFKCYESLPVSYITLNAYEQTDKVAYLTFDDGPSKRVTPKVLDILDDYDIQASFFLIGSKAEKYPEIVKREYEGGHFIGNHTYSHHNNEIYTSKEAFLKEIERTDNVIAGILGVDEFKCKIFRFPNGSKAGQYSVQKRKCFKYLDEIGYNYIDWNALNNDSIRKYTREQLISNLKKTVKGKKAVIILMHDSGDVNKTYDVLEASIKFLRNEGFEFRTLYDFVE